MEEALAPGATIASVADRHGVARSQVYGWLKKARAGKLPGISISSAACAGFVPVKVEEPPAPPARCSAPAARRRAPVVEIALGNGRTIKADEEIDPAVWPGLLPRSMEAAFALVEAEDEFVEIGLQMFTAQAVIDGKTQVFRFENSLLDAGQDDRRRQVSDDMRIVAAMGHSGIGSKSVGFRGGAGGNAGLHERVQRAGAVICDHAEPTLFQPVVTRLGMQTFPPLRRGLSA